MPSADEIARREYDAARVFTPSQPIQASDMFAGRLSQMTMMLDAISQPGHHAIIFGERGVGKTSITNVVSEAISSRSKKILLPRVNCLSDDDFRSIWRRQFSQIQLQEERVSPGFSPKPTIVTTTAADDLSDDFGPDDVRKVIELVSGNHTFAFIFDEFDVIKNKRSQAMMADTIKMMSDYGVQATVMLVGVADSIDDMISHHQSIERAIIQIPMPRMSPAEIGEIFAKGLSKLGMQAPKVASDELKRFAQGLPHVAHLLSLHATKVAIGRGSVEITSRDIHAGVAAALGQWTQSTRNSYYNATKSPQPGHKYREVLLACALADTDELGYFAARDVRAPLEVITGRKRGIQNFSRHLRELHTGRGQVISSKGDDRRRRYRFNSPLMRPYVVMRAFHDGIVTDKQLKELSHS
jgi:hypothetical protein